MLKNKYVSRPIALYSLLVMALFIVLTACGGDNNTSTVTTTPTAGSTTIVGTTNTPSAPSPTSPRPTPTPTLSRPTPTPTVFRPSPTPIPPKPTPTPPKPTPTPAPTVVVTIITQSNGAFAFSPQALNVAAGTTVTWNNNTSAPHTVTGTTFGSGTISPGGSFSFKFTQGGTFAYHCMFHPYMTASVSVK